MIDVYRIVVDDKVIITPYFQTKAFHFVALQIIMIIIAKLNLILPIIDA